MKSAVLGYETREDGSVVPRLVTISWVILTLLAVFNLEEIRSLGLGLVMLLGVLSRLTFRGEVGAISRRLRKEFRAQLLGMIVAVVLPGLILSFGDGWSGPALFTYIAGCALVGATSVGAEFERQTLGQLFSQPISRQRILVEKLWVLGVILLVSRLPWILTGWESRSHDFEVGIMEAGPFRWILSRLELFIDSTNPSSLTVDEVVPFLAWGIAPAMALWTRSVLGGMVLAVATPGVLWVMTDVANMWLFNGYSGHSRQESVLRASIVGMVQLLNLTLVAAFGWHHWLRLQVKGVQSSGGGLGNLQLQLPWHAHREWQSPRNPSLALIAKEYRLHTIPQFLIAILLGLLVVRWGAIRMAGQVALESGDWSMMGTLVQQLRAPEVAVIFVAVVAGLVCLAAGATCITEERHFATLEWQLTQPVTVRRQWGIKLLVAFGVSLFFGILIPSAVAYWITSGVESKELSEIRSGIARYGPWVGLGITAIGFYSSAISRNTVKAFCFAVLIAYGLLLVAVLGFHLPNSNFHERQSVLSNQWNQYWDEFNSVGTGTESADKRARIYAEAKQWKENVSSMTPTEEWIVQGIASTRESVGGILLTSWLTLNSVFLCLSLRHFRRGVPSLRSLGMEMTAIVGLVAFFAGLFGFAVGYYDYVGWRRQVKTFSNPSEYRHPRKPTPPVSRSGLIVSPDNYPIIGPDGLIVVQISAVDGEHHYLKLIRHVTGKAQAIESDQQLLFPGWFVSTQEKNRVWVYDGREGVSILDFSESGVKTLRWGESERGRCPSAFWEHLPQSVRDRLKIPRP
jgi:ABC-type transport system involved in multi-copper enzyme maturation permease subunit